MGSNPDFCIKRGTATFEFSEFSQSKSRRLGFRVFVYHANDHNLLRTQKFWFRAKNLKKHVPRRGIEPRPRRWERRILTTRPPGKVIFRRDQFSGRSHLLILHNVFIPTCAMFPYVSFGPLYNTWYMAQIHQKSILMTMYTIWEHICERKVLPLCHDRDSQSSAVTRIRTWVVSATTRSTNHYTITAIQATGDRGP